MTPRTVKALMVVGCLVGTVPTFHTGVVRADSYTVTGLGTLDGGNISIALGINNAGQVVGWSTTPNATFAHAFLYSGGVMQDLGTPGVDSVAMGINATGQIVGYSNDADGNPQAFLYSGGMQNLGTLGGASSTATAINDAGQVIGNSATAAGLDHPFLYSGGTMLDLGTFDFRPSGGTTAINSGGQVVGYLNSSIRRHCACVLI